MEYNAIIEKNNAPDFEQLSLGELLKINREKHNIKIEEISNFLKVRSSDIALLENNDIEKIAKNIYIPGLIKSYGNHLKINAKIIDEKIHELSLRSNVEVKKHTLLNIGDDRELSPNKEFFFNSLIISIILLLVFIILRH